MNIIHIECINDMECHVLFESRLFHTAIHPKIKLYSSMLNRSLFYYATGILAVLPAGHRNGYVSDSVVA
jgi:hypothetical protein